MSKITSFTKTNATVLQTAMLRELEKLGVKYGVKFKAAGGTIDTHSAIVKIEAAVIQANGKVHDVHAEDFKKYSKDCHVPAKFLNKTFTYDGKKCKLVGMSPRSYKFPFIIEINGQKRKATARMVQQGFGLE